MYVRYLHGDYVVNIHYNGEFSSDIVLSVDPMLPLLGNLIKYHLEFCAYSRLPKRFDNFSPDKQGGYYSESLDAFRFFFEQQTAKKSTTTTYYYII